MLETSARLLRLLSLLQARPEWTGPELAERMGVTTRTVRRDVDKLRGLDYPVEVDFGPGGGYRLGAGAALPPLLLDDDEAVAVAVTLRTAAGSGVAGTGETALAALVKLERILPARLRHRIAAMPVATVAPRVAPSVDASVLAAVGGACRDRRVLEIDYTARDGTPTRRRIEPIHLVAWGRRWYLVAWDRDREDWRTLRVDRLVPRLAPDGLPTGPRFAPREIPGGDPAAFVADRVADVRPFRCVVRVAAPAPQVRATIWTDQVRVDELGPQECRVSLASDDARSAALILTGLDADFVVESPDALVDELRRVADRYTRAVGRPAQPAQPIVPPTSQPIP
ncbi:helix-turn-helix transcriptional regulator [Actinomycetospora lemnae]|uniref:YafY family protein n=1 Tax=Actinomycetospora lemnae TaxID=3019891 RepID=A0ABT5T161_9PSEU|nr:YafY family protein [Actinomycetospora sp. DW7H6]MDD7968749.1 YafY family protein [Actinomycetospora sp. DW7H6]